MNNGESRYPLDWFRIGDKELVRAKNLLMLQDLEGAGFNIHQAVEKYLKGYLLSKGWKLRRIHDLDTLINECIQYDSSFESFRKSCQKMTQYYIEDRYPMPSISKLTLKEVKESLDVAEKIIKKIQKLTA